MRSLWIGVLGLAAACTGDSSTVDGFEEGKAVSCHHYSDNLCLPHDLEAGRVVTTVDGPDLMAGNSTGSLVRAHDGKIAWLDGSFNVARTAAIDADADITDLHLSRLGRIFITAGAFISLDFDGSELWRSAALLPDTVSDVSTGDLHICVIGHGPITLGGEQIAGGFVMAVDHATGARIWARSFDASVVRGAHVAALSGGGCAYGFAFTGQIDGLTATGMGSGAVFAVDGMGRTLWTQQLDAMGPTPSGEIFAIAAALDGSVAVSLAFQGDTATFAGKSLSARGRPNGSAVLLLSPTGTVTQLHLHPGTTYEPVTALVTDGKSIAGAETSHVLLFDTTSDPYASVTAGWAPIGWTSQAHVLALGATLFFQASLARVDDGDETQPLTYYGAEIPANGFIFGSLRR